MPMLSPGSDVAQRWTAAPCGHGRHRDPWLLLRVAHLPVWVDDRTVAAGRRQKARDAWHGAAHARVVMGE